MLSSWAQKAHVKPKALCWAVAVPAQRESHWLLYVFLPQSQGGGGTSVAKTCLTLCDPMDCSPPVSSEHGILQARIQEWVAMPSSRGTSWPRDQTCISCIAGRFFTVWATRKDPHLSQLIPNYTGPSDISASLGSPPFSEFSNNSPLAQVLAEVALYTWDSIRLFNVCRIERAPDQNCGGCWRQGRREDPAPALAGRQIKQ